MTRETALRQAATGHGGARRRSASRCRRRRTDPRLGRAWTSCRRLGRGRGPRCQTAAGRSRAVPMSPTTGLSAPFLTRLLLPTSCRSLYVNGCTRFYLVPKERTSRGHSPVSSSSRVVASRPCWIRFSCPVASDVHIPRTFVLDMLREVSSYYGPSLSPAAAMCVVTRSILYVRGAPNIVF